MKLKDNTMRKIDSVSCVERNTKQMRKLCSILSLKWQNVMIRFFPKTKTRHIDVEKFLQQQENLSKDTNSTKQ